MPAQDAAILRCPGCSRAGPDLGTCGRGLTCPVTHGQDPVPVDPKTDAVIRCNRCDITRALNVQQVMNQPGSSTVPIEHHCPLGKDSCQAFFMRIDPPTKGKVRATEEV